MMFSKFFKLIVSLTCILVSSFALANHETNLVCPTADEIKQFTYIASFPYGFNGKSKRLQLIASAIQLSALDLNEDESETDYAGWVLMIHPLEIERSESSYDAVANTLDHLQPVSDTPFMHSAAGDVINSDRELLPVCAYTLPGNQHLNALAYYFDNSYDEDMDDEDAAAAKLHSNIKHQRKRFYKIAKYIKQLTS